jgi:CheY-like chemotaxis protein
MRVILLVDDDDLFGGMVNKMLDRGGYEVIRTRSGKEALGLYDPQKVDLVLTDLMMPDMEGIELIIELRRRHPGIKIIAMSGGGKNRPEAYLSVARRLGAARTLAKPFSNEELFTAIQGVIGLEGK